VVVEASMNGTSTIDFVVTLYRFCSSSLCLLGFPQPAKTLLVFSFKGIGLLLLTV
jgi:hypothetical protein